MIPKQFDQIEKSDVESLVEHQVPESRTIEYKQELPGNSDGDKKEFLADVSSFANAAGGDILYGVIEDRDSDGKHTGMPLKITGLSNINVDAQKLRLDNIILNGLDPRIPGIRTRSVDDFSDGPVFLLRIPQSWASPHMVTFKGTSRFFSRTSAGKYQLDVNEIRAAILLSESRTERIRQFRMDRLAKVVSGETPVLLRNNPKIVLHIIPMSVGDLQTSIDLEKTSLMRPPPLGWEIGSPRYNFDGLLSCIRGSSDEHGCYLQIFRSGEFESVNAEIIRSTDSDDIWVPIQVVQDRLCSALLKYFEIYQDLHEIEPPVFVLLSLLGVKGMKVPGDRVPFADEVQSIDRDDLLLPEILVQDFDVDPWDLMQPAFDAIWQASGWPRCLYYDSDKNGI